MATQDTDQRLFKDIIFHIDPSVGEIKLKELQVAMIEAGAKQCPLPEKNQDIGYPISFDYTKVTHVVTLNPCFNEYLLVKDGEVAVVTPSWVERGLALGCLHDPKFYSPNPAMIFSGVVVTTCELPENDVAAIFAGVASLGGQWRDSLSRDVTHLVTLAPSGSKYKTAIELSNLGFKIVLPHWFDDCFKLRRRIPETPYQFPDPPIMNSDIDLSKSTMENDSKAFPFTISIQESDLNAKLANNERFLDGKSVYISLDVDVRTELLKALKERIVGAGGTIDESLSKETDIYVGIYRSGSEYVRASKAGVMVGSLTWLYHILTLGRIESPLSHLLHYPAPKTPLPGMENAIITISNYTGSSREYIKRLIAACGAKFTPTMSPYNTHLIAADRTGSKVEKAPSWNIDLINHTWLEDSYRQWEMKSVSDPRYTHFPPGVNHAVLLGQTTLGDWLDETVLKKWYEGVDVEPLHASKVQLEQILKNGIDNQENTPPCAKPQSKSSNKIKNIKVASKAIPIGTVTEETNNVSQRPDAIDVFETPISKKKPPLKKGTVEENRDTSKRKRENTTILSQTSKFNNATIDEDSDHLTSESQTPTKKKKSSKISTDSAKKARNKRGSSVNNPPLSSPISGKNSQTQPQFVILMTGFDKADKRVSVLKQLGAKVLDDIPKTGSITHCIANRIVRTPKFLAALSRGAIIVTDKWIDSCLKAKTLVEDYKLYQLQDKTTEKKYDFSLIESLDRARLQGPVFEGVTFYVTSGTEPDASTLRKVCEHAGGRVSMTTNPSARTLSNPVNYLISCEKDRKLWEPLLNHDIKVYTPELILTGLLRQSLETDQHFLTS